MPSTSDRQRRFMAAVAHDASFAARAGVPQSVGKEFNDADKKKEKPSMLKVYRRVKRGY